MKKRIISFFMFVLLIFSVNVVALAGDKNTLVVAQGSEPKSLDPVASNDVPSHRVYLHIYDTLLQRDEKGNLVPGLAESWEQVDPLTIVLHLRKGVKFHNGDNFTAKDVVFSLNRAKESPAVMTFFKDIKNVEVVDDYTVKIITDKPFGPLLGYLAHKGGCILSENAVKTAGDAYAQFPIGTGPYKFVEWRSGDRVVLKANPDYFGGKPATENLVFRVISEGTNRTIALETKEVDLAYDIEPMDVQFIKQNNEIKLIEQPSISISYLGFNTQKPPFDKKEVRQAIAYAIDIPSIINAVYLGAATEADSPVPAGVPGYTKTGKKYEHDIAKAKELLAKAGYPNGFKAKIALNDNNIRKDTAVILQDQLKRIGIDLEVEVIEWGAYLDKLSRGEQDMFILGWVSSPDCDAALYSLFHSSNKGSAGNRTFYENKRVDELLDQGRVNTDLEKRKEFYKETQEIIQEDIPMFVMVYPYTNAAMQKNIKNFNLDLENEHRLYKVSKE